MKKIKLGKKIVDKDNLYFVADIGANHDGSLEKAIELINLAKEAGADAAKFQNFMASKIVSKVEFDNLKGKLSHQSNWKKSVYEVYENASIDKNWTETLKNECDNLGIDYFTSPYDYESVDLVDPFVDIYKIGSGDASWLEIIEYVISKQKPVLLATGACSWEDVQRLMNLALSKTIEIVLMQCNTNYTGNLENFKYSNLNVLKLYAEKYPDIMLGLSDHTPGHSTVLGALTLGARVFEKHFTNDNNQDGPDHGFAMNPNTWKEMVESSHELLSALGDGEKRVEENEQQSYIVQRRCICASQTLIPGHIITESDLIPLRPIVPNSFQPYESKELIGKIINKEVVSGQAIIKENLL